MRHFILHLFIKLTLGYSESKIIRIIIKKLQGNKCVLYFEKFFSCEVIGLYILNNEMFLAE